MFIRRTRQTGPLTSLLPERTECVVYGLRRKALIKKEQDVKMRVKAILAMGDFQSPDGSTNTQELSELLPSTAGCSAAPCCMDLFQECRQIVAKPVRHCQGQHENIPLTGFGESQSSGQFGTTTLADFGGTNRASPYGSADLEAGVERLVVFLALEYLERLIWHSPTHALGRSGSW